MSKYYKWTLDEPVVIDLNILIRGRSFKFDDFHNKWCDITNNIMTISAQYSWDGCTPKRKLFNKFVIGTWDGPIIKSVRNIYICLQPNTKLLFKQLCYYPSLLHDVICQFHIGKKKLADLLFKYMLFQLKFKLAIVYYGAVRLASKIAGDKDGWLTEAWQGD
jgi:hypothetical protein